MSLVGAFCYGSSRKLGDCLVQVRTRGCVVFCRAFQSPSVARGGSGTLEPNAILESESKREKLAWQKHTAESPALFCCSQSHNRKCIH